MYYLKSILHDSFFWIDVGLTCILLVEDSELFELFPNKNIKNIAAITTAAQIKNSVKSKSSGLFLFDIYPLVLKDADLIVLLGARLNWMLHFGQPPRFTKDVKIVQVIE